MSRTIDYQRIMSGLAFVLLLTAGQLACADEADCQKLAAQTVAASVIGLPTTGAKVTSAHFETASASAPAFCKVLGEIAPVDAKAPAIRFELNLPANWNEKVIQYGGGGLNGMLVTAVEPLRDDPPLVPSPLMRGFVTFGTDAGHQTDREHDIQVFALNDEALVNHAYAAYKKTHDVALSLLASYYGKRPARVYFIGGSEGGREAMVAAQRFPADYDGVIATVPVLSWTGTNIAEYRQWQAMMDGGWMSAAKVALVQHAVLKACDELDGIEDGVLARYEGCKAEAAIKALRCTDGKDAGDTCLSDKQLALIRIVHEPTRYRSSLAHGEREYAGYPVGGEANPGAYIPTLLPPAQPASDDNGRRNYSVGDVRYFIARDPDFRARLDEKTYAAQISKVSGLMDMNDPDLRAFYARGGKMIIKENGADYLVAPGSVYRYYKNVVKKMGKPTAEKFVRLYVAPWVQHGGQGVAGDGSAVPDKVDLLPVLEGWVEQGKPPADQLVLTSYSKEGLTLRSWPLCRYGEYPHYENNGHPKAAASYTCRSLN